VSYTKKESPAVAGLISPRKGEALEYHFVVLIYIASFLKMSRGCRFLIIYLVISKTEITHLPHTPPSPLNSHLPAVLLAKLNMNSAIRTTPRKDSVKAVIFATPTG